MKFAGAKHAPDKPAASFPFNFPYKDSILGETILSHV